MRIRSIRYYVNEAFRGLLRNRLMSFASIGTVAACILMLSLSFCMVVNLNGILKQIESTVGLTVYIEDKLSADEVNQLFTKVKAVPNVKYVKYVSAEEALQQFSKDLSGDSGDDSSLLDGLEHDNPFPRSFNIEMQDTKLQAELVKQLEGMKDSGIWKIKYQQHVVEALNSVNKALGITSIVMISVLLIISFIIIINTIKITVNNRRTEINIMKYVGATDWFIRWPFIIEGVLIGFIGAGIPLFLCMVGYNEILKVIYEQFPMLQNIVVFQTGVEVFSILIPLALGLGILLGTFGSLTSIRRHLKV